MNPTEKDSTEQIQSKNPLATRPAKKKRGLARFLLLLISYVIVAAIVWQVAEQWKVDPAKQQERAEQEIRNTVERVRKLMILPEPDAELPQVAVINDAEGLAKTQAFFSDVKNGDQVLIYLKSQKAIIYRASENKIVNVGPVIADNSTNTGARPATTQTPTPTSTTSGNSDDSSENRSNSSTSSASTR